MSEEKAKLINDLKEMIVEECDADFSVDDIGDDERLVGEGLELDSLDALQIALAVKDRYGVRIEGGPDSREAFSSVSKLADFIMSHKAAA
ncbi:phosphopantetheine-binding protein [Henriciella litoralis]|uniref:phosphopantetheine-binding protein n=1 Tax=Henriciella litoralis TaxID=568102 RepID=UPI0009FD6791|nr:phosphopantetheine-binding protein [Henriciella litoralis]